MHSARRGTVAVLLLLFANPLISQTTKAADARLVVVRAAKMLDIKPGKVVANAVVIIEGERIKEAGPGLTVPAGAKVLDLGGATLMPGLIDAHTHFLQNYDFALGGDNNPTSRTIVIPASRSSRPIFAPSSARSAGLICATVSTMLDTGRSVARCDRTGEDQVRDEEWGSVSERLCPTLHPIGRGVGLFC